MEIYGYKIISPSTKIQYEGVYEKHIKPSFGRMKLTKITAYDIRMKIVQIDKDGFGFVTQDRVRIILVDMFDKAVRDYFATENIVKGIRPARDEKQEQRVLSQEEQAVFFDYTKWTFYDNMFVVVASSGLRLGEMYVLEETDLDFEKKVIRVTKSLSYPKFEGDEGKIFHFGPPKTKSSYRDIPMNKRREVALEKQILQKRVLAMRRSATPIKGFENQLFTTRFNMPLSA